MTAKPPVIVDCDTGIDDALALLYLLHDPANDLRAITTVSGNIDATTAARNTLHVLTLLGRTDIPVAVGVADNQHTSYEPAPHVHGTDGIGNTNPPSPATAPVTEPAAELIVRMAREHPGELNLLALGPLTNLASALRLEPALPELVPHVTIMGGALHHPGNVTPAAEANIHNDPEAARIVLHAGWNITLVPLDVTMNHVLTAEQQTRLRNRATPTSEFAADILDCYLDSYESHVFDQRQAGCHDPLAAAVAVGDLTIHSGPIVAVDVDTGDGPARGATIADTRGRYRNYPPQPTAHTRIVLRTADFTSLLIDRLCHSAAPADLTTADTPLAGLRPDSAGNAADTS